MIFLIICLLPLIILYVIWGVNFLATLIDKYIDPKLRRREEINSLRKLASGVNGTLVRMDIEKYLTSKNANLVGARSRIETILKNQEKGGVK